MSEWIGATLLVVIFAALVQRLGLMKRGEDVVSIALDSLGVIGSSALSDEEKETKLQRNSIKLFGLFFTLAWLGGIALLLPMGLLWLCDKLGWLSFNSVLETTVSPLFLIFSSLTVLLILGLRHRSISARKSQIGNYSKLDQTLHRVAFRTYTVQVALANFEDKILRKELALCRTDRSVFITALPRAGTTLLLECCAGLPEFAAHCYRDMPFVLTPYLWNRYSKVFQQQAMSQERAHGDGMVISPDSHEALEEVIWTTFWNEHYCEDRIIPWASETNIEFERFFHFHMCKIILLRRRQAARSARYISKNNANIARIKVLSTLSPNAVIIIPFRNPFHHAVSLLQQHLNFLHIHENDTFALEYMKAIGHYDFGQNLCPIDFDGWLDKRQSEDARSLTFWLEYWVACYRYLLADNARQSLYFFNYDALCKDPIMGFRTLAEVVDSSDSELLISNASRIGSPRPKQIDTGSLPSSLLQEVNSVYGWLKDASLNRVGYPE